MATAGLVIVGNELLTGKTADENTPYLTRRLWELGVEVRRVELVPDELDEIARAVRQASQGFELVFTSGGIGPTHDDLTVPGIARALDRDLVAYPELEALIAAYYRVERLTPVQARMARVPAGSRLVYPPDGRFPQLVVENVYVLPGIPWLLRRKFEEVAHLFRREPFQRERLDLLAEEVEIAPVLNQAVERWGAVRFGSYPYLREGEWRVELTLESRSHADLSQALEFLRESLQG
ncbi:MAG: competence/damage-inducible protein A [Candidatus Eremiobacterota bacterium]